MLQVKNVKKQYRTGNLVQKALDGVSLNLRDNEFVAILGPSGSGKTTLLNVIGGLDRYDSGELIINGLTTKKYKDSDWDYYRNHTIGFVFQSYNLIPHQTLLANVELALTISGISGSERKQRALKALESVGLKEQAHKKPNQLSGGQMQRVAIARALVNDPDIVLADEPTGALDSETSVQVMNLLQEVAKDRLVVMVTHNPELAEQYATRIVTIKDGKLIQKPVYSAFSLKEDLLFDAKKGNVITDRMHAEMPRACVMRIDNPEHQSLCFNLFTWGRERGFEIAYDTNTHKLTIDRSMMHNIPNREFGLTRTITLENELSALDIFVDHSTIEIFVNDGEYVMSSRIFPERSENMIRMAGRDIDVKVYTAERTVEEDFVL